MTPEMAIGPLVGGALIGLAASLTLLTQGRIAGISGVYGGLLKPRAGDIGWRAAFVGGLLLAGLLLVAISPAAIAPTTTSTSGLVVAGLLVGVGVRMGNGCTSGHGVCGLSRFSRRSLVATLSFMATGMVTASLLQVFGGGA